MNALPHNIYVSSDWHLWNKNSTDTHHPYKTKKHIDDIAIAHATTIGPNDVFIHLGDLSDPAATDVDQMKNIIQNIPGFKILCRGNHDIESDDYYKDLGFNIVCDAVTYYNIVFSHKPCKVDQDQLNIHGHLHSEVMSVLDHRYINAFNGENEHYPISIDDLIDKALSDTSNYSVKKIVYVKNAYDTIDRNGYTNKLTDVYDIAKYLADIESKESFNESAITSAESLNEVLFDDVWDARFFESDDDDFRDKWRAAEIRESAEDLHIMDRDEKRKTANKYGINPIGMDDEESEKKKETPQDRLDKLREQRKKSLSKARKVKRRKRFVRKLKSKLPGVKNENSVSVDDGDADYLNGPNVDTNTLYGKRVLVFNDVNSSEPEDNEFSTTIKFANENAIIDDKDLILNLNKWKPEKNHNILFITGLSGSGKTTLAEEYERKYHAHMFELDGIEYDYDSSNIKILNQLKEQYPEYNNAIKNKFNGMPQDKKASILIQACKKAVNIMYTIPDTLFIVEGIQLYDFFDVSYVIGKPLIILGTSTTKSMIQAAKRILTNDVSFNSKDVISSIKKYWNDHQKLKNFKDQLNESYSFNMVDHVQFIDPINEAAQPNEKLYPVYIMLVHSGTPLANAIKTVTHSNFSHSSISFDASMTNMYSFGRKSDLNPLIGTFVREDVRSEFFKKRSIPYALYVVPSTKNEITAMKKRLDYFIKNSTQFHYDFTGLFKNYLGIADNPEYKWFCSRFVADILNSGRPRENPYVEEPSLMKPEDFRDTNFAQYVDGGILNSYDPKQIEKITKGLLRAERIRRLAINDQNNILQEMSVTSTYDDDHVQKGKLSLSKFKRESIGDDYINKNKDTITSLKHLDTDDTIVGWFDGDKLVGYVSVSEKDKRVWITALEVTPDYQKYGLGKQILNYATSKLKAVALSVNTKNTVAIDMYKSAGFKISKNKSMNQHMYTMILHESTSPATVEYTYDFARENVYSDDVMRYKLSLMDETAFENFMIYLKSFKLRFDRQGNIIITRREFDQLDAVFKNSLKLIKAYEKSGNVEGVKNELAKIYYMMELINTYYLNPKAKDRNDTVKKDMTDLRSVMLNVFQQHLKFVTTREPRFNFQTYYDNSKYGKTATIPQSVLTTIGKVVKTALI